MLSFLRRGRRWFTAAIGIGVGGVFGLYMGVGGPIEGGRSAGNWITVGPYGFGAREFEQSRIQREEQLKQALGDNFDARAMRATIDQMATNVIVQRAVLAIEAEHQGLVVATKEIERSILDVPGFRGSDNRFDRQQFSDWVEYNYGNERNFMRDQRTRLLAEKMLTFMRSNAAVTDDEARLSVRQRLEEVRIGFVALDAGEAPEDFEPEEIQVDAFLEARESEARDLYSQRNATFNVPEQVRARHILFRVDKDADEEAVDAARKKAEIAIVRLEEEEFADLAEEISDDVGSKLEGGDLGFFGRGRMVKAFEDAAFALEAGQTTEPVRSDFGFHVIRVEEKKAAENRSFEEVREELAVELLGRDAAREDARALAQTISAEVSGDKDLETAVRDQDLTLERSGLLRRRPDGFVPSLGAAQDLMAAAFTMQPGESSPRVFEVGEKFVLVQLLERNAVDPAEIDGQLEAERKKLLERKRSAQVETWIQWRRRSLEASGQLTIDLASIQSLR